MTTCCIDDEDVVVRLFFAGWLPKTIIWGWWWCFLVHFFLVTTDYSYGFFTVVVWMIYVHFYYNYEWMKKNHQFQCQAMHRIFFWFFPFLIFSFLDSRHYHHHVVISTRNTFHFLPFKLLFTTTYYSILSHFIEIFFIGFFCRCWLIGLCTRCCCGGGVGGFDFRHDHQSPWIGNWLFYFSLFFHIEWLVEFLDILMGSTFTI